MTISAIKMTAEQYLQLGEDPPGVRLELVDGDIVVSPSPTPEHSRTVTQILVLLTMYVEQGRLGEVLADVDTIFGEYDVRRPDVLFFTAARRNLIGQKRLTGRPDLAVEVISPGSGKTDRSEKFKQYAKGGVKHYWIVDPEERTFRGYTLRAGKYVLAVKGDHNDTVRADPFKDLAIPLRRLWWRN